MRRPVSSGMRYAPNVRRARRTKKRGPAMQKMSTMRTHGRKTFKGQLTIWLDLGWVAAFSMSATGKTEVSCNI